MAGYLKVIEDVPVSFTRRSGDWVQEGGNNTLVVLGTDRLIPDGPATFDDGLGSVDSDGEGEGTGTAMIVVGRKDMEEGNPDVSADDAMLYMSMKTDVDQNMGLTEIPEAHPDGLEPEDFTGPAALLKADALRLMFRESFKMAPEDATSYIYHNNDVIQMKMKDNVFITVQEDNVLIEVMKGDNIIHVKDDGTIDIFSTAEVNVKTKKFSVVADDEITMETAKFTLDASDNATITSPTVQVTADQSFTVDSTSGQLVIDATGGHLMPNLDVTMMLTAAGKSMKMSGGSMTINGTVTTTGNVVSSADVKAGAISLTSHKHPVAGVKAGPDAVTTLPSIP